LERQGVWCKCLYKGKTERQENEVEIMRRAIIYQIGRLEQNAFEKIKFVIKEKEFDAYLSSFAIRDYLQKDGFEPEVVLIYPVSLPFNRSLTNNDKIISSCGSECYEYLKYAFNNAYDYLKNPDELFKSHPYSKETENFVVIHSLGQYETPSCRIDFDCEYSDIVIHILIDMIKRFISNERKYEKIIADISSGHNIYVSAFIEALRYFAVWLQLYNYGQEKDAPEIEIAFGDPVIPGVGSKYAIHFEGQSIKAFFSSPVSNDDISNNKLSRSIYPEKDKRHMKGQLQSILEGFVITFSSIKNNTSLVIYHTGYHSEDDILNTLKELLENTEKRLKEKYINSPKLKKNNYLKAFLVCGFYSGLSGLLKKEKVSFENNQHISIQTLLDSFRNIYRAFGLTLNETILGNEVDKLKKDIKEDTDWTSLIGLLYSGDKRNTRPQKRNFFAHAGFEGTLTECKRYEGSIYLKYNNRYYNTIKKWLMESA